MRIVVLNGSPKGEVSVTMQYVAFVQKKLTEHEFDIIHAAQRIREIEKDEVAFNAVITAVKQADVLLWAYPVYYRLVHADYKRFIELVKEKKAQSAFRGKYAAILTTSIHFFDNTAQNYIHGISEDWEMKVYDGFSAGMNDLFTVSGQEKLLAFFHNFVDVVERDAPVPRVYSPIVSQDIEYCPSSDDFSVDTSGLKIAIVTDATEVNNNLRKMTDKINGYFQGTAQIVNLHDINIKGGCLGCIHCGYDNSCIYNDGFVDFFNSLKSADIIVFAGSIHDRYLSSLWKTFADRSFFNNHVPAFSGKQMAYLISGPLRQLSNTRQILESYVEAQPANLVGIVSDEDGVPAVTDGLLRELALSSVKNARSGYIKPQTFLAVAGHKILRDAVWGHLRFPFVADHKYYQTKGLYDFPQKDYKTRLRNFGLGLLVKIPAVRKQVYGSKMREHMISGYKKLLSKI